MKRGIFLVVLFLLIVFFSSMILSCGVSGQEKKSVPETTAKAADIQTEEKQEESRIKAQPIGWIYCFNERGELMIFSMVSQFEIKNVNGLTYAWWKDERDTVLSWTGEFLYSQEMLNINGDHGKFFKE